MQSWCVPDCIVAGTNAMFCGRGRYRRCHGDGEILIGRTQTRFSGFRSFVGSASYTWPALPIPYTTVPFPFEALKVKRLNENTDYEAHCTTLGFRIIQLWISPISKRLICKWFRINSIETRVSRFACQMKLNYYCVANRIHLEFDWNVRRDMIFAPNWVNAMCANTIHLTLNVNKWFNDLIEDLRKKKKKIIKIECVRGRISVVVSVTKMAAFDFFLSNTPNLPKKKQKKMKKFNSIEIRYHFECPNKTTKFSYFSALFIFRWLKSFHFNEILVFTCAGVLFAESFHRAESCWWQTGAEFYIRRTMCLEFIAKQLVIIQTAACNNYYFYYGLNLTLNCFFCVVFVFLFDSFCFCVFSLSSSVLHDTVQYWLLALDTGWPARQAGRQASVESCI